MASKDGERTFKQIAKRWVAITTWVSAPGKRDGRRYTYLDFPQLKNRHEFWLPWAAAWNAGNEDETAITAQIANLMGAEEEARALNVNMIPPRIPVPEEPRPISWDMVEASPALSTAEAVDVEARAMGRDAGDLWAGIPTGVKVVGGLALGAWVLSSLARILRR